MERSYWEKIAPDYEAEIFDVLRSDRKKLILAAIRKYASPLKTVMDAGCAVGKWLPVLSPLFSKVYALDISARNLAIARDKYPALKNVTYRRMDMSATGMTVPRCDMVICINAILSASLKKRDAFFKTLSSAVKKKGQLILVIPSLESFLLSRIVANQWKIDQDVLSENISPKNAKINWQNILQGNAPIDGVPTKHYLKEELELLLAQAGFDDLQFKKIQYEWETEFLDVPQWLNDPKPWDWLCIANKR